MKNEELETLAELGKTLSGALQAREVIQDVLVSTLLMEDPERALVMAKHLEVRYDHAPGSLEGTALRVFQDRIDAFRHALELLGPSKT